MPPVMLFSPARLPRSSTSVWMPLRDSSAAAARPAGPAPTTTASYFSDINVPPGRRVPRKCGSLRSRDVLRSSLLPPELLDRFSELRRHVEQVAHDVDVRELAD